MPCDNEIIFWPSGGCKGGARALIWVKKSQKEGEPAGQANKKHAHPSPLLAQGLNSPLYTTFEVENLVKILYSLVNRNI